MAEHILIACMPKSGSTYLTEILAALPGFERVHLVPAYGAREQELCAHLIEDVDRYNYVAQHHVRASEYTQHLLRVYGLKTIVLVRDLCDVVASLADHLRRETAAIPMGWFDEALVQEGGDRLYEAIIDLALPWYVSFQASWQRADPNLPVRWQSYEQLVADPAREVAEVVRTFGLAHTEAEIAAAVRQAEEGATRRNKAELGRGRRLLCDEHVASIEKLAAYCPEVGPSSSPPDRPRWHGWLAHGWSLEREGAWSTAGRATIYIPVSDVGGPDSPPALVLRLRPLVCAGQIPSQIVQVNVGGNFVATYTLDESGATSITVPLPPAAGEPAYRIDLGFPNARSPRALGCGPDTRLLAACLTGVELQ